MDSVDLENSASQKETYSQNRIQSSASHTSSSGSSSHSVHSSNQITALNSPSDLENPQQHLQEKNIEPTQDEEELPDLSALYSTTSHISLPPPPDGGAKAWTQVAMGWLIIFLTWGYINSFGAFQAHYEDVLPQSPSTISWIGSVQICLTFVIGAFSGRMLDAGYFLPTFFVGAALHSLGVFMMSISKEYWQLMLTQGVLTGIGNGIVFTPSLALVATYFNKRRAFAVGMCTTANSLGGVVYPIIVRELLPKVGFGWTTRTLGLINTVFLILTGMFMRPRLPPRKSGALIDTTAFKEKVWIAYVLAMFFNMWSTYWTFYYVNHNSSPLPLFLFGMNCVHFADKGKQVAPFAVQRLDMSFSASSLIVTILNGVGLPFRAFVPLLADKFGPLNIIVPVIFCLSIVNFCWLAVEGRVGFYIFIVFYGMFAGSLQCLMPTGMASITPKINFIGTRLGMMFSFVSIAGLTGPPVGGALQDVGVGEYKPAIAWSATVMFVAFVCLLGARVFKAGWGLSVHC